MKGSDKLKERLPNYQGRKIRKFSAIAFIVLSSSLVFQLLMDSISRIFSENGILQILAPVTPILGSLFILCIGFTLVFFFWRSRDKYLRDYGELAYQKAFKFVVTGIPMVISVIVHSFFPTNFIVPFKDTQNLSWYLANPILDIFPNFLFPLFFIRFIIFFLLAGFGAYFAFKTLKVFGIDYMALVYVYFPEESTLQNHEIYSVLRHPTYHALMLVSIGSIFLRFSIYSIVYFLIFMIGISIHLKYVEEEELIKRFGEGYRKYKEEVPAFIIRLKDLKKYLSFCFGKSV